MAEEVKAVHREPHPFIGIAQIMNFVGRPVAFVGRIERFEENTMFMKTHEGMLRYTSINLAFSPFSYRYITEFCLLL